MNYEFLMSGIVFGLTAGLVPGALQTLVISQTLKHGIKEGLVVSLAPLLTDVPIIAMTVLVLSQLASVDVMMGVLSLAGAGFLVYLAHGNLTISGQKTVQCEEAPGSLKKGFLTNVLNPHPYMFWLLVGGPSILRAYQVNLVSAGLFVLSLYICLVGTFMIIAGLAHTSRAVLKGKGYIYTIRALGILLLVFALRFFWESLKFFGIR
jgi:threonine/homoserine/homoserine lactone efflux protein